MSDICGVISFNNQPASQETLSKMVGVVEYPNFEGQENYIEGEIGLAYKHQATISDFSKTKLPLISKNKTLILIADARIDNRDELIRKLNLSSEYNFELADAQLIIAAFEKWGANCGAHIIGDFAIVIWDKSQRQLTCIRDVFGNRPLFYFYDANKFIFASQIKQILAHPQVQTSLNEKAIGYYLTGRPIGYLVENTFYNNIFRLKPAELIQIDISGRINTKKYWNIDSKRTIKLRNDEDYAQAFFSLLSTSVKAQSRSQDPIGIMVSGGMDSSSVAAMLAHLGSNEYKLFNVSYGEGHAADESNYVKELASKLGSNLVTIDGTKNLPFSNLIDQADNFDEPLLNWDYANVNNCFSTIRETGCRTVFTGYSGDSLFLVQPVVFIDYFKQHRFLHAYKEYEAYLNNFSISSNATMLRIFAHQMIPDIFKTRFKKYKNPNPVIHPHLLNKISQDENWKKPFNLRDYGFSTGHQNQRYYYFTEFLVNYIQMIHQLTLRHGIECRDPLGDRRIVEYILAIPPDQCLNNGITKFILRNSMKGFIPESIRLRQNKTTFESIMYQGLSQWLSNEPPIPDKKWLSVERGFIAAENAKKQLKLLKDTHNRSKSPNINLIQSHMRLQLLEQWLKKTL